VEDTDQDPTGGINDAQAEMRIPQGQNRASLRLVKRVEAVGATQGPCRVINLLIVLGTQTKNLNLMTEKKRRLIWGIIRINVLIRGKCQETFMGIRIVVKTTQA